MDGLFGIPGIPEGEVYHRGKPGKSKLFVYYSGHGLPTTAGKRNGYLVPIDCKQQNFRISSYSMDTFYTNLNLVPARHITVVFDACFSGKSVDGDLITEVSGLIIPELKVGNFNDKTNHVILTSSDGDQFSNWSPSEKRHGLFTYFFLKGLRGEADLNSNYRLLYTNYSRI